MHEIFPGRTMKLQRGQIKEEKDSKCLGSTEQREHGKGEEASASRLKNLESVKVKSNCKNERKDVQNSGEMMIVCG